mgnify:CR=1 FL=1
MVILGQKEIEISGRKIGSNHPPLVIAEIGINHGGSLDVAKLMVDTAVAAGIEIIKHQTHIVEDEMSNEAKFVVPSHTEENIFDIIAQCALSKKDEWGLMQHVNDRDCIFISTRSDQF